jgi:hypothetical protein
MSPSLVRANAAQKPWFAEYAQMNQLSCWQWYLPAAFVQFRCQLLIAYVDGTLDDVLQGCASGSDRQLHAQPQCTFGNLPVVDEALDLLLGGDANLLRNLRISLLTCSSFMPPLLCDPGLSLPSEREKALVLLY